LLSTETGSSRAGISPGNPAVDDKGRFILSVNDVPEMREVFARFAVENVATRYTVAGGKWSDVAEIIVTGPGHDAILPASDLLSCLQGNNSQMTPGKPSLAAILE
jgi:hypothetical protein